MSKSSGCRIWMSTWSIMFLAYIAWESGMLMLLSGAAFLAVAGSYHRWFHGHWPMGPLAYGEVSES